MTFEDLFYLIRTEPVCLFIGSGFSFYAGMPGAGEIKDILYDTLTDIQKTQLDKGKDLAPFTDDFVALTNRAKLVSLLQQRFSQPPSSTHLHDMLARVPYFRSIITTNYDHLIEDSYTSRAVITSNETVFVPGIVKTKIYKVHGDIDDGKSIVITTADYTKMYNRNFKDPFWAAVINVISSHHVIFLGFSYEDPNIWGDFDYIGEKLKNRAKKRILITRTMSDLKQKKLKQMSIQFLAGTGEIFVNDLVANIKQNIVIDHRKQLVDTQTAIDFTTAFDMQVEIKANKYISEIVSLTKTTGPTHSLIKLSSSDKKLIESFKNFRESYDMKDLEISGKQLDTFSINVEDFGFMSKDELAYLNLKHVPKSKGQCSVKFTQSGYVVNQVGYELYNTIAGKLRLECKLNDYEINFDIDLTEQPFTLNFRGQQCEIIPSISKYYTVFKALHLLFSGERIEIKLKGRQPIPFRVHHEKFAKTFGEHMKFYDLLKKIEQYFRIKFQPISIAAITEDDDLKVNKLANLIEHGYHAVRDSSGITIDQMPNEKTVFDSLERGVLPGSYMSVRTKSPREIKLFGKTFDLGAEQVTLKQPTLAENDFENLHIRLVPVDEMIIYHYERFGFLDLVQSEVLWGNE